MSLKSIQQVKTLWWHSEAFTMTLKLISITKCLFQANISPNVK